MIVIFLVWSLSLVIFAYAGCHVDNKPSVYLIWSLRSHFQPQTRWRFVNDRISSSVMSGPPKLAFHLYLRLHPRSAITIFLALGKFRSLEELDKWTPFLEGGGRVWKQQRSTLPPSWSWRVSIASIDRLMQGISIYEVCLHQESRTGWDRTSPLQADFDVPWRPRGMLINKGSEIISEV